MTDHAQLWRATAGMTVGTALSRLTGLARIIALTYALGVTGTKLADTYNLANTTPNIVYELFLGGILTAVFVPVLVGARERREGDPSALVSVALVALAVVSAVAAVAAPLVIRIYTFRIADPALRAAQQELATFLLRWFAPQIFFYGASAITSALLNVRGKFNPPMFAPVLNNLVGVATFIAYARVISTNSLDASWGAKTLLGAGTTAGVVMQALVLLPFLRGEQLRFRPALTDPAVLRVVRLSGYIIGYVAINQIGLWVILALANGEPGGVTAYQVAFMFLQLPHSLFAVSLFTALVPGLSRAAAARDWDTYRQSFAVGVRGVFFLIAPAAIGYAILARPITEVFLARGAAGVRDAAAVGVVLQAFTAGLVFFSAFQLLTRCFYALPDTRTPAALNAAAVAVTAAVNLPLFAWLGVKGLAFGHAIGYAVGSILLLTVLTRRVPDGLGLRALLAPLARNGACVGVMGACTWVIARIVPGTLLRVGVTVGAGAILYLAFSQVAGVEERRIVLDLFGRLRPRARGGPA